MSFSGLTQRVVSSRQRSSRQGARIDTFLIHHQAGTNSESVLRAMASGAKQVSANYVITNEGELVGVVDEQDRAWTSGSSRDGGRGAMWDRRSITVEIENETAGPDWRISAAAMRTAALLLEDLRRRYGVSTVLGHRDLWARYRASYSTFCPGPATVATIVGMAGTGGIALPPVTSATPPSPAPAANYAFGLSAPAMRATQAALARLGRYTGVQDGAFGPMSVQALQRFLRDAGLLPASYVIDGIPGATYGRAVQTLAARHGYTGPLDGAPGAATSEGIFEWAATVGGAPHRAVSAEGRDFSYWEPTGDLGKRVQRALARRGRYDGSVDGVFGPMTRKGVQRTLATSGVFVGAIDGVIGANGARGVQQYAARFGSYVGPIDGAPREASWSGFALGLERP